jgi:predicted Zn-dependent protease with MMP-like domain
MRGTKCAVVRDRELDHLAALVTVALAEEPKDVRTVTGEPVADVCDRPIDEVAKFLVLMAPCGRHRQPPGHEIRDNFTTSARPRSRPQMWA